MDSGDDGPAAPGHVLHGFHDGLGHEGIQASGGLVQEHHGWICQHLRYRLRDGEALSASGPVVHREYVH